MQTFLDQIAATLWKNHPSGMQDILVLMPNRRGEVFLKRALAAQTKGPFLAPQIGTIEDFVQRVSGYKNLSQLELLIALFKMYQSIKPTETFDDFAKWGATLLQDFNEIDRHLIDAAQLYQNLLDIKKLESWGVAPGQETELMHNFLTFWRQLHGLYENFREGLKNQNNSYQGMAYRKVADNLHLLDHLLAGKYQAIYLVGFNALNKAEEAIFKHFIAEHNAHIFWDADAFYTDDVGHEAGEFLRYYRKTWPKLAHEPFNWVQSFFASTPKNIQIVSAPGQQGMAQAVASMLGQMPETDHVGTALVLADEAMLLPMLDVIPDNFEAINVTMGLPLAYTVVAQDFATLCQLHVQAERNQLSHGTYKYYFEPMRAALDTTVFRHQVGYQNARQVAQQITTQNLVFVAPEKVKALLAEAAILQPAWHQFFQQPKSAIDFLKAIDGILIDYMQEVQNLDAVSHQAFFTLHKLHGTALEVLSALPEGLSMQTFGRLYKTMLREQTIDFYGEPLAGLQVMGMLETRTLDFERVIITSLNEGILPSGKSQNSFIPFDLKVAFNMPTHNEKDAIYAYHFYRLLQRASQIWLVYDSSTSSFGSKEKSRFIAQIENELAHLPNITLQETRHYNAPVPAESLQKVPAFIKDEHAIARLQNMTNYGISASAIIAFINDPADFYVSRLLRVNDPEDVEETIAHNVLGNVVHEALEKLYQPYLNQVIKVENLAEARKQSGQIVQEMLKKNYLGNTKEGRNLLISNVADHMVKQVLQVDVGRVKNPTQLPITLQGLETTLEYTTKIPGIAQPIKFVGTADRIERCGNEVFVIDYKTGFVGSSDLGIPNADVLFAPTKKNKAFQVMYYAWLYQKMHPETTWQLTAGVFATRNPSQGFMQLKNDKNTEIGQEELQIFESLLFDLMREMFDSEMPFAPRTTLLENEENE